MSLPHDTLGPGDPIYHPKHGFGTVQGLTRRDPAQPLREAHTGDAAQDYYEIQLAEGGSLLVPVLRAPKVGLRLLTNSVAVVLTNLRTPAEDLPQDARARSLALRTRSQGSEPSALITSVRDLLVFGRDHNLTASEKTWLDKSTERLSIEAALVDRISRVEAREAISAAMNQISGR